MQEMRVYVGTYGKYNNGSIEGEWLDIEDYSDKDEFLEACQALHGPGEHEFMFQDHEGIPSRYISESHISEDLWEEWLELDDRDKEICVAYWNDVDASESPEKVMDRYYGSYASAEDWAQEFMNETMEIPDHLQCYIDYQAYARDARLGGDMTFVEVGRREVMAFNNH